MSSKSLPSFFIFALTAVTVLSACSTIPQPVPANNASASAYLQGRFAASQQSYAEASAAFNVAALQSDVPKVEAAAFRFALVGGDIPAALKHAAHMLEDIEAEATVDEDDKEPLTHANVGKSFVDRDLPRLTLAIEQFSLSNYSDAKELLSSPFDTPLGKSMALLVRAWSDYATDGVTAGVKALTRPDQDVYTGFSAFHLALMSDLSNQSVPARAGYGSALQGAADDLALVAFAGFLERNGTEEEAVSFYKKLSADRGYVRRVGRLGLVRLDAAEVQETASFSRVAKNAPLQMVQSPQDGVALAMLNFASSAYEQGIEQKRAAFNAGFTDFPVNMDVPLALAQLAVHLDDDLGVAHYLIGSINGMYKNYPAAVKAQSRVPNTSWRYNYAVIEQANGYLAMGRPVAAIRLLEGYLKEDALAPDVAISLAEVYGDQEQWDKAVEAAGRAIDIASRLSTEETRSANLWRYHFARGVMLTQGDRWEEGEKELSTALSLSPDDPILLNYLGYSYVERGERIEDAFDMIERALGAMPASGSITDSLGWAYYQRGDYDKAVTYLERAVTLEPGSDTITDHLGDAYWQTGRYTEAKFEWRRVLELDEVDPELREKVVAKLAGEVPAPGAHAASSLEGEKPAENSDG